MNKIAVVGHPSIASQTLADMLHQQGIAQARPSKREQLLPAEITATLCQAHQVPAQAHLHAKTPLAPIKIGPVWHGLALDLLLGNVEQTAWCWADPRSIFVLDFWRDIDPELAFVLVYDHPAQALLLDVPDVDPASREKLDHWVAYNQMLLSFYHRHRERCLLVHAQQARDSTQHYLDELKTTLEIPLADASKIQSLAESQAETDLASDDNLHLLRATQVESYLAPDLLATHPASAQLYQELQAAANLPCDKEISNRPSAEEAWEALSHLRHQVSELKARPAQKETSELKDLQEENELLLLQLHQVQEELERYFLANQELKQGRPAAAQPTQAYSHSYSGAYYGAADRIKSQLTYRLGATLVAHSRKPVDWLRMPGALLREVKDFKQEKPQREAQKLPPISTYADAYEAERIKRHLSYRLGTVLMKNSSSPWGWLTMPWKMRKAVRAFRADRKQAGF